MYTSIEYRAKANSSYGWESELMFDFSFFLHFSLYFSHHFISWYLVRWKKKLTFTEYVWCAMYKTIGSVQFNCFSSVQSLSRVQLFATPWTAARQVSLSITTPSAYSNSCLVMASNHLILCHPLLLLPSIFPSIRVFSDEAVLHISDQRIWVSASASVRPVNIQDWFPLWWTGWISLQSKGLSRVFSNSTVQKHQFFGTQPSL